MKYRIRWAKRGKLRYVSHHDEALIFERAARRSDMPLAYSKGFSPHPKIAFGSGLPVGYGSEVELLDIELTEPRPPKEVGDALGAGLPDGLAVLGVAELVPGARSLGALIHAASYEIFCDEPWIAEAVDAFMRLTAYEIDRPYKGGLRRDDIRAGVISASTSRGVVSMVCAVQPRATRPSDVFAALERERAVTRTKVRYQRTALLTYNEGGYQMLNELQQQTKVAV